MRCEVARLVLLVLAAALGASVGRAAAIAPPVGCVRIVIPAQEQRLVSLPFRPFDPSINAVLAGQLTGSSNEAQADCVLKWDAGAQRYVSSVKADGTGDATRDGRWFSSFDGWAPSDMTLSPGEGFFLCNRQDYGQTVLLCGQVVFDATNTVTLAPALNLFGYPYSTAVGVQTTRLWQAWQIAEAGAADTVIDLSADGASAPFLRLGNGYWYDRRAPTPLAWSEPRPYADVFASNGVAAQVIGIAAVDGGTAVKLSIRCAGSSGNGLDVLYQDLADGGSLNPATGWRVAAAGLPPEGQAELEWTDTGFDAQNPPLARYYLVAAAGAVMPGEDGSLRDGNVPQTGVAAGAVIQNQGEGGDAVAQPGRGGAGVATSPPRAPRVIYVDAAAGNDALDGLDVTVKGGGCGPKRSIRMALKAAVRGDIVSVAGGTYREGAVGVGEGILMTTRGAVIVCDESR
jgi:hypothetical protein